LAYFGKTYRLILVETNGQPNLSEGNTPAVKLLEYGEWGKEIFEALRIDKAFIAGASFGGLICMKVALVIHDRIKAPMLLKPGCFRPISFEYKNLYYNLLPLFKTSKKNIVSFLDKVVFHKPTYKISAAAEQHLIDYLSLAIGQYKDNTQKPYYMKDQLNEVKVSTYLIVGKYEILLPYQKSVANAKAHLNKNLKNVFVESYGHVIEIYPKAIQQIQNIIKN